jgi:hypothetical protein
VPDIEMEELYLRFDEAVEHTERSGGGQAGFGWFMPMMYVNPWIRMGKKV